MNTDTTVNRVMTLQEAKEIVARGRGYDDWKEVEDTLYGSKLIAICNDAAETYARSKWDQACDEQRDHCVAQFINSPDVKVNQYSAREYCANAPKPEFKP